MYRPEYLVSSYGYSIEGFHSRFVGSTTEPWMKPLSVDLPKNTNKQKKCGTRLRGKAKSTISTSDKLLIDCAGVYKII